MYMGINHFSDTFSPCYIVNLANLPILCIIDLQKESGLYENGDPGLVKCSSTIQVGMKNVLVLNDI